MLEHGSDCKQQEGRSDSKLIGAKCKRRVLTSDRFFHQRSVRVRRDRDKSTNTFDTENNWSYSEDHHRGRAFAKTDASLRKLVADYRRFD